MATFMLLVLIFLTDGFYGCLAAVRARLHAPGNGRGMLEPYR